MSENNVVNRKNKLDLNKKVYQVLLNQDERAALEFYETLLEGIENTKIDIEKTIKKIKSLEMEIEEYNTQIGKNRFMLKQYELIIENLSKEYQNAIKVHKTHEGIERINEKYNKE